ncbi:uncharacterized protein Z519_12362 [Cladophialophora bantiana CBS 173.52]|uniref:Uncharacterized protein n=1 Tax=Cladophialophora bantiana (strain ATCC 10958 / CBS 173.52 / CDC B-1940 / NIH 8579) TaxID=1442370 RepID=A0A0D2H885_CLAB1|nr:uncharacterized protein Z519_12362 [Cladophialophora bantiana CBS 173.52]KIW87065.1 hypothetical protein Z519_12362 [Cladophialophora bantiana CBS 173.52]
MTVGLSLTDTGEASPGFQWSLALSHLRYYGEPVSVQTDHDQNGRNFALLRLDLYLRTGICRNMPLAEYDRFFTWLQPLVRASSLLVNRSENESADYEELVRYGRRRCKYLLGGSRMEFENRPFFGLCIPYYVTRGLATPSGLEEYLQSLRSVAESSRFVTFSVIRYCKTIADTEVVVLATATPYTWPLDQRAATDGCKPQKFHARSVAESLIFEEVV